MNVFKLKYTHYYFSIILLAFFGLHFVERKKLEYDAKTDYYKWVTNDNSDIFIRTPTDPNYPRFCVSKVKVKEYQNYFVIDSESTNRLDGMLYLHPGGKSTTSHEEGWKFLKKQFEMYVWK